MKTCRLFKKAHRARILIESFRFPPFGFDIAEISSHSNEDMSVFQKGLSCPDSDRERSVSPPLVRLQTYRFFKKTYRARILIESARFPPFGFAIAEISSNSNEDTSVSQKDLSCPDSDRECSAPPFVFDITEVSLETSKCLGGNREAKSILN